MAYNIYNDGFRVLGTRNWDLRWIIGQVLVDTRRFSGSECHTLHTILDPRQLTLGIDKLVNRCFADLEVYMPNDQS